MLLTLGPALGFVLLLASLATHSQARYSRWGCRSHWDHYRDQTADEGARLNWTHATTRRRPDPIRDHGVLHMDVGTPTHIDYRDKYQWLPVLPRLLFRLVPALSSGTKDFVVDRCQSCLYEYHKHSRDVPPPHSTFDCPSPVVSCSPFRKAKRTDAYW